MTITTEQINNIIKRIQEIESTMIVRVGILYTNIKDEYAFSVDPSNSTQYPYITIENDNYLYHLNFNKTLNLGVAEQNVAAKNAKKNDLKQKAAELHQRLNIQLIKNLIAEDGTLLFGEACDENEKLVYKLYRDAILDRLNKSVLPKKQSQLQGGVSIPVIMGGPEALIIGAILLLCAAIIPLITLYADLEDFYQSIKIKQSGEAVGTKLLVLGNLLVGAALLVTINPIGGTVGFVVLSICALIGVAILYRSAKYLINYEHAPYAALCVSKKERNTLEKVHSTEKTNTIECAINMLAEKDKNLYGPQAKLRSPFWNEKNQKEHRDIINMVTKFKSNAVKDYTEAEIVKETVLFAADSILRIK